MAGPMKFGVVLFAAAATACTTVLVNSTDGVSVIGRTMELGSMDLPPRVTNEEVWKMMTYPRGSRLPGAGETQIGSVGVGFYPPGASEGTLGDGMNEFGLSVMALSFNSQGAYQETATGPSVPCTQVVPFLLGTAKSVAEAVARLEKSTVVDDPAFSALVGRFHWSVQDETGAMVVLEYVGGELRVHDASRVGVLTNDPTYDWHLTNLHRFALYSLDRVQDSSWGPEGPPKVFGHGLNTVGLPGSYSPPDRFAKMFLLREAAVKNAPPATAADAIALASGLLNTVHIIMGTVANTEHEDAGGLEWTEWSLVKIPAERRFLVRTYSALGWREVDLKAVDFTKAAPPVPLYRGLDIRAFDFPSAAREL
jgi:choloylglycine hydrolase